MLFVFSAGGGGGAFVVIDALRALCTLVPMTFRATTAKVYEAPAVKPVMVHVVVTVVQLWPAFEVATYSVIVEPPVTSGACQLTVADVPSIATEEIAVGESGSVIATVTSGSWVSRVWTLPFSVAVPRTRTSVPTNL